MSIPAEHLDKPKRKYTKRAKAAADSPAELHIPSSEAPTHSMPCCVILGSYLQKSEVNDEMIRKFTRCGKESKWVPKIIFKGRHFKMQKDDEGNNVQVRTGKIFTMPVVWQPVCEKHKAEIQKNAGILLTNQWINEQTRSFIDMGFPSPEAEMTKMQWHPYVYEEPEVNNDIIDHLQAIANERAEIIRQPGFAGIKQEEV